MMLHVSRTRSGLRIVQASLSVDKFPSWLWSGDVGVFSSVGSHCGHGVAVRDVFWENHIATMCIHVRIDTHDSPPRNQ